MVAKTIKTALVVDWLTEGFGGGERVIKAVHELYPEAPIYTSQYRPKRTVWLGEADVRTGWLNVVPQRLRRFIPFLRQLYFSHLDLSAYDLVISITGAEAKAVKTRPDALHVSYIHAPTQYYWTLYEDYMKEPGFGLLDPLARVALKLLLGPLRRADFQAAQRPNIIITISSYMKAEIKKHYCRESTIVAPPVGVRTIQGMETKHAKREGYVIACRQVTWKRVDLAIATALVTGEKLMVIGDGPEHQRLVRQAGNAMNITFLPGYSDITEIIKQIRASKAFLFPSREPFGIAPVEALAAGTPVIALKKGGALDFIKEGVNGVFFSEQTPENLAQAIDQFKAMRFDHKVVTESAHNFSEEAFIQRLQAVIEKSQP